MQDIGKPGWFSRPKGKIRKPGTIFGYLFDDDPNAVRPAIPPREPWSEDETDKREADDIKHRSSIELSSTQWTVPAKAFE